MEAGGLLIVPSDPWEMRIFPPTAPHSIGLKILVPSMGCFLRGLNKGPTDLMSQLLPGYEGSRGSRIASRERRRSAPVPPPADRELGGCCSMGQTGGPHSLPTPTPPQCHSK